MEDKEWGSSRTWRGLGLKTGVGLWGFVIFFKIANVSVGAIPEADRSM